MATGSTAPAVNQLLRSLSIQRRVIWALLLREMMTRFGRHNIGFLWLFMEPMLFTLGVTALWNIIDAKHYSNLPITAFAVTGYSSVLLWRNMPGRCILAVSPNLALMYHRNVRVIDIFVARLLLEGGGATISFVALSLIFVWIGWMPWPEDVLQIIGGWFMLAWFGSALAIFLGAMSERREIIEKIWHPLAYIVLPLSGAGFTLDSIPASFREVLLYVPMVSGIEFVREGYFGSKIVSHYDMTYMAICCLCVTLLAFAQERIVSRTVVPE
jgi:ABC-2 type transport system permease protein/capsular polysaccharide transport system permease protein